MGTAPASFPDAVFNHGNGAWEIRWSQTDQRQYARWIDVREVAEYSALPKLPFADTVPLAGVVSSLKDENRDAAIVVVCRSGGRSARAASMLNQLGFSNVVSLQGGMTYVASAKG